MKGVSRVGVVIAWTCSILAVGSGWPAEAPSGPLVRRATPPKGMPWLIVEAEDTKVCHTKGEASVVHFPPQTVVVLRPDASLTLSLDAAAVYLRLPFEFTGPGPGYGMGCDPAAKLRYSIDGRVAEEVFPFRAPREFALAESLSPGTHTLQVQAVGAACAVDGFRIAPQALSRVEGVITADLHSELLTDVRAEVLSREKVVRTEYLRTAHDGGTFQLIGLPRGAYGLRFIAAGWDPLEIPTVAIERESAVVDLGVLVLRRSRWACSQSWYGDAAPPPDGALRR